MGGFPGRLAFGTNWLKHRSEQTLMDNRTTFRSHLPSPAEHRDRPVFKDLPNYIDDCRAVVSQRCTMNVVMRWLSTGWDSIGLWSLGARQRIKHLRNRRAAPPTQADQASSLGARFVAAVASVVAPGAAHGRTGSHMCILPHKKRCSSKFGPAPGGPLQRKPFKI